MLREIVWDDVHMEREQATLVEEHGEAWTALGPRTWSVLKSGKRFKVECLEGPGADGRVVVRINGVRKEVRVLDERTKLLEKMGMSIKEGATSGDVKAPMPGKVLQVLVQPGESVTEGQPLLVLEAMKMENVIKAEAEALVSSVPVAVGEAVEKGALLVGFDA